MLNGRDFIANPFSLQPRESCIVTMHETESKLVYQNSGNQLVLALVPETAQRILDVGCGAGDIARCLKSATNRFVCGLTNNEREAESARAFIDSVHVADLVSDPVENVGEPFDVLIFSHVLEHLPDPTKILRKLLPLLRPGGSVVIAIPNVLEWRTRLAFLRGRFEYVEHGVLDRTHLRFYTPRTALKELVEPIKALRVEEVRYSGSFPLGPLRHHILWHSLRRRIDWAATQNWPTLFAGEIAILARKEMITKP